VKEVATVAQSTALDARYAGVINDCSTDDSSLAAISPLI
jgi:hypothetical protein